MSHPPASLPCSGDITTVDGFTIHTFTSSGTLAPIGAIEYLVVAGGGSGAHGGGGGGGVVTGWSSLASIVGNVVVGEGGIGGNDAGYAWPGTKGTDSSLGSIVAKGGGRGGAFAYSSEQDGGSGGGAGYDRDAATDQGSGTDGQGYAGPCQQSRLVIAG